MPTQDELVAAMQKKQRAWKRMIHDTCRSNWAKRVRTKPELIEFNASMKKLDEELDKLEETHPEALEAMAGECAKIPAEKTMPDAYWSRDAL